MQFDMPHALGSVPQLANPLKFSESAIEYQRAPPLLGADTQKVLSTRLGLDAARIAQLRSAGVIAMAD